MTHPMQAARKAALKTMRRAGNDPDYTNIEDAADAIARAVITAFLDAVDADPRQSQLHAMQHGMIAALKRIAEETP